MTAIAWAIVFYTVTTNNPTVPMILISWIGIIICTMFEIAKKS